MSSAVCLAQEIERHGELGEVQQLIRADGDKEPMTLAREWRPRIHERSSVLRDRVVSLRPNARFHLKEP